MDEKGKKWAAVDDVMLEGMRQLSRPGIKIPFSYVMIQKQMEELKRRALTESLAHFNWNLTRAAKAMGVGRTTLYRWMKRLGIERPKKYPGLPLLAEQGPCSQDAADSLNKIFSRKEKP